MTTKTHQLVLIGWNVRVTHKPKAVVSAVKVMAREHRPDMIYLAEATHCYAELDLAGYDHYQAKPAPTRTGRVDELADSALLIRHGIEVSQHRICMTIPFTGPDNDRLHDPRVYRAARLTLEDDSTWRVSGQHWPTGGLHGKNRGAVKESIEDANKWLAFTPELPSVLLGDLNLSRAETIKQLGGTVLGDPGVDHAVLRHCNGSATRLPMHGSDHHAWLYRVTTR